MKKWFQIFILAAAHFIFSGAAYANHGVEGYWLTEDEKAVIRIEPCKDSVCGDVYWLAEDAMQYDSENPDEAVRGGPMCGLKIMWGFTRRGPAAWSDGSIYKADDGDLYHAEIDLRDDGRLALRGYVGVPLFGKSQVWNRINPDDYKRCAPPSEPWTPQPTKKESKKKSYNE